MPLVVTTAEVVRPKNPIPDGDEGSSAASETGMLSMPSSTPAAAPDTANDVRSAFGNFLNDYFKAVQGVLMTPDATGQVNPKAHRADFDATVNQALRTLEFRLTATVSRYPSTWPWPPRSRRRSEATGPRASRPNSASSPLPKARRPPSSATSP